MRIKGEYILYSIGNQEIAIPIGENAEGFNGIIKLNSVAAFIWRMLQDEVNMDELLIAVTDKFEVNYEAAQKDIVKFLNLLRKNGILE